MKTLFKQLLRCAAIAATLASLPLHAQPYPSKPIRVVVPATPGTGQDLITRVISAKLSERLQQPIIVENRAGAGAIVGVSYLKNAPPDGYTLGLVTSANSVQPWLIKNLPFDLRKDFSVLTLSYTVPLIMVVPENFPAKTVPEFVAYAKENAGKLFFGTVGVGSTGHLTGELFKQMAGIDMTAVPFKGIPEAVAAMAGGHIGLFFSDYTAVQALVESRRARVLAVASKQRMAALPNVPSFSEYYPGFEVVGWTGFAAPFGTPKEIVDKLATELIAVIRMPDVRKQIADTGVEPSGITPTEFAALIASDIQKWGPVAQKAGLKME